MITNIEGNIMTIDKSQIHHMLDGIEVVVELHRFFTHNETGLAWLFSKDLIEYFAEAAVHQASSDVAAERIELLQRIRELGWRIRELEGIELPPHIVPPKGG